MKPFVSISDLWVPPDPFSIFTWYWSSAVVKSHIWMQDTKNTSCHIHNTNASEETNRQSQKKDPIKKKNATESKPKCAFSMNYILDITSCMFFKKLAIISP